MSKSVQPFTMPLDLRRELPNPLSPWMISGRLFNALEFHGPLYKRARVLPEDKEWRFIWRYFHADKPTKYGIKQIWCVHERDQQQIFEANLSTQEREAKTFPPTWDKEPRAQQRESVIGKWTQVTNAFSPFESQELDGRTRTWTHTKVLPLWHGTDGPICDSICASGFVYFGKHSMGGAKPKSTDVGYFGSGIYFTDSPRYSADIYSKGHMLLAWVSMRHPFPLVGDPKQQDMNALRGNGAYKNYNAHYVPVVPTKNSSTCPVYHPAQAGQTPICDEYVVFHKSQALPRFWVELEVEVPYVLDPSHAPQLAEELVSHLMHILQNPYVDQDASLRNYLNGELGVLLKLNVNQALSEQQLTLFGHLAHLITQGKVDKTVRNRLVPSSFPPSPVPQAIPVVAPAAPAVAPVVPSVAPVVAPTISSVAPVTLSLPFEKRMWDVYFGDPGIDPPPPLHLLDQACPFYPNRKVGETHLLVLMTPAVNGTPHSLDSFRGCIQNPKEGRPANYHQYSEQVQKAHGSTACAKPYWVLITKNPLPRSLNKTFAQQKELLAQYEGYTLPRAIEVVTAVGAEHARSGVPWHSDAYTRCEEKVGARPVIVGKFSRAGINIIANLDWAYEDHGVSPVRRIEI